MSHCNKCFQRFDDCSDCFLQHKRSNILQCVGGFALCMLIANSVVYWFVTYTPMVMCMVGVLTIVMASMAFLFYKLGRA
jgi:hypothetical protein